MRMVKIEGWWWNSIDLGPISDIEEDDNGDHRFLVRFISNDEELTVTNKTKEKAEEEIARIVDTINCESNHNIQVQKKRLGFE